MKDGCENFKYYIIIKHCDTEYTINLVISSELSISELTTEEMNYR